jgi:YggT family protein
MGEEKRMLILVIDRIFMVYMVMLLVRILGSWVQELQQYRFMQFIAFYTDPYLDIFRRVIPPLGMIDISPIAAYFCLVYLLEPLTKWIAYILFYR